MRSARQEETRSIICLNCSRYSISTEKLAGSQFVLGPLGRHRFDTLIAVHALSIPAILITNNLKDFKSIPGLRVEPWVTGDSLI